MSMIWGGSLDARLSKYTSLITKITIANKYGKLNYSTKAYPSPALTNEEWEIVFQIYQEKNPGSNYWVQGYYFGMDENIESAREPVRQRYFARSRSLTNDNINGEYKAMPSSVIPAIKEKITSLKHIGEIQTEYHDVEVIDRMERCIVKDRYGLMISTKEQLTNLEKYYSDDQDSSYVIYYDVKTMLPLFRTTDDGRIVGLEGRTTGYDVDNDMKEDNDKFTLKIGTPYYKWSRTVKRKSDGDGILGKTLVIDSETFPETYKIVGETYIREQKTGKDQRYQFVIHRAQVSSDTSITLEAEGDPTTFSMTVDVLSPENDIMIELKQYDVDEDPIHGGTRIIPQKDRYTTTNTEPGKVIKPGNAGFENPEIY